MKGWSQVMTIAWGKHNVAYTICSRAQPHIVIGSVRESACIVISYYMSKVGLQQTTRAPGSDKTRGQGSFGSFYKKFKKKRMDCTFDPFLLRQGEPGTSQYLFLFPIGWSIWPIRSSRRRKIIIDPNLEEYGTSIQWQWSDDELYR